MVDFFCLFMLESGLLEDECSEWLDECLKVFPKLEKYVVTARYCRMSKKLLSRIKISTLSMDIDVEALLLRGKRKSESGLKLRGFCEVLINSKLKEIDNREVRKQIVQHNMIHNLLYAEKKDLEINGEKGKGKAKKTEDEEFEEEVFQRYNKLRELNGLPPIKEREDLNLAFSKVLTKLNEKLSQQAKKAKESKGKEN